MPTDRPPDTRERLPFGGRSEVLGTRGRRSCATPIPTETDSPTASNSGIRAACGLRERRQRSPTTSASPEIRTAAPREVRARNRHLPLPLPHPHPLPHRHLPPLRRHLLLPPPRLHPRRRLHLPPLPHPHLPPLPHCHPLRLLLSHNAPKRTTSCSWGRVREEAPPRRSFVPGVRRSRGSRQEGTRAVVLCSTPRWILEATHNLCGRRPRFARPRDATFPTRFRSERVGKRPTTSVSATGR